MANINTKTIIKQLTEISAQSQCSKENYQELPEPLHVEAALQHLRYALFPELINKKHSEVEYELNEFLNIMTVEIARSLSLKPEHASTDFSSRTKIAETILQTYVEGLPDVLSLCLTDLDAIYQGDPAAHSLREISISYPSFQAIMIYRLAHPFYLAGVPIISRIMTEYAHKITGIDIHPGAKIGPHFCIDHGTGIVIGETCEIGQNVKLYQGVTLGALSLAKGRGLKGVKRHPTIEDDVVIYANASILGGDTVIGRGAVIGGNVFITKSVAPATEIYLDAGELPLKSRAKR